MHAFMLANAYRFEYNRQQFTLSRRSQQNKTILARHKENKQIRRGASHKNVRGIYSVVLLYIVARCFHMQDCHGNIISYTRSLYMHSISIMFFLLSRITGVRVCFYIVGTCFASWKTFAHTHSAVQLNFPHHRDSTRNTLQTNPTRERNKEHEHRRAISQRPQAGTERRNTNLNQIHISPSCAAEIWP